MKNVKPRRLIALAVIGIPWFMRDQLASSFESHSATSQQIQVALANEEARQLQEQDQREAYERLIKIERLLTHSTVPDDKDPGFEKAIAEEGRELGESVANFQARLGSLNLDEAEVAGFHLAADSATAAAKALVTDYGSENTTVAQDSLILARFDSAASHFNEELKVLSVQSVNASAGYSRLATWSRFVAWLMTAIGALMMGDFTKLLAGPRADGLVEGEETT